MNSIRKRPGPVPSGIEKITVGVQVRKETWAQFRRMVFNRHSGRRNGALTVELQQAVELWIERNIAWDYKL